MLVYDYHQKIMYKVENFLYSLSCESSKCENGFLLIVLVLHVDNAIQTNTNKIPTLSGQPSSKQITALLIA